MITEQTLQAIEAHLHALIRYRAGQLIEEHAVRLPSLGVMLTERATEEFMPAPGEAEVWFFRVPGMYGGFRLRWIADEPEAKLEAVSFCCVVGGSGQRHEITAHGCVLVESGLY